MRYFQITGDDSGQLKVIRNADTEAAREKVQGAAGFPLDLVATEVDTLTRGNEMVLLVAFRNEGYGKFDNQRLQAALSAIRDILASLCRENSTIGRCKELYVIPIYVTDECGRYVCRELRGFWMRNHLDARATAP